MANGIWRRNRSGRNEVWITYKDHTGKKHREKVGLDTPETHATAQDVLTKRRNEAMTNKFFPERMVLNTTFKEAAQRYWDLVGYKSDKSWEWRWNQLVKEFGHLRLVEVKSDIIQRWYNRRVAASKTGAGSANRTLTLLKAIFNRATDWDLYNGVNPIRKVLKEPDPEHRNRTLSIEEMPILFAACDPRLLPIVIFALLTGVRKTIALWFRWEDVEPDLSFITARSLKGGNSSVIPVTPKLRQLLLQLGPRAEGRLFDLCPMTFRRLFDKARVNAGLRPFTWHDLRRTFATRFNKVTKDKAALKKLIGHRSSAMLDRYIIVGVEDLLEPMNAYDAAMPELPATLREFVPLGVGHHVGHQPERQPVDAEVLNKEIAIMPR